ncbi:HAD-IA family hydrolase [Deinococcus sp. SL84]|uniref:HAD-IA family hydrolase n=1 Tax=Deinococcus sp. SL84 TaxID=2994663 RepID=UPI0022752539|nr:HAD-IA family hydrolase [Deinococcus sp. SL84]MCY1703940.1 HAD-IA family hydrolase [Deinococcus sp. SL84]
MSSGPLALPTKPVQAVLFDLDDTLVDSGHLESFRLNRDRQGLEGALPDLKAPPNMHEQLRRLGQSLPLGVVTTAPRWYAERLLTHLYPDIRWQALVTYGDVQRRKPDPQGLLMAVEQLGLAPSSEIAYVGDQETDLEAARRAGLLPVQARWCCDSVRSATELCLEHPRELACFTASQQLVSSTAERLLTLLQLPGVGRTTVLNVLATASLGLEGFPDEPRVVKALQRPGAWDEAQEEAGKIIASCQATGIQILALGDSLYPKNLAAMGKDQPPLLYVQGQLSQGPALAVIGTREPTAHGLEITRRVATHFAARCSIVSGLALGVDSMAHRAALQAGGHTVAVLGHGHGLVAPKQNEALAEEILSGGGALVSEYPPRTPVRPAYFVERDRIQAGLANATVVVQTDLEGGSWHAARKTLAYGRVLGYPVPTRRDLEAGEPKIQGILLLEEGKAEQKAEHLKCRQVDLGRVIRIASKADYSTFENRTAAMQST